MDREPVSFDINTADMDKDIQFQRWARHEGLFETPSGLERLHKISPGYFQRRIQFEKWRINIQWRLSEIEMSGVQNEEDLEFVSALNNLQAQGRNNDAAYEPGIIARILLGQAQGRNNDAAYEPGLIARILLGQEPQLVKTAATRSLQDLVAWHLSDSKWTVLGRTNPNDLHGRRTDLIDFCSSPDSRIINKFWRSLQAFFVCSNKNQA